MIAGVRVPGLYIVLFGVGTLLLAAHGIDLRTSASSAAAALGNVGPTGRHRADGALGYLPASAKLVQPIDDRGPARNLHGAGTRSARCLDGARRARRPSRCRTGPQAVERRDSVRTDGPVPLVDQHHFRTVGLGFFVGHQHVAHDDYDVARLLEANGAVDDDLALRSPSITLRFGLAVVDIDDLYAHMEYPPPTGPGRS